MKVIKVHPVTATENGTIVKRKDYKLRGFIDRYLDLVEETL